MLTARQVLHKMPHVSYTTPRHQLGMGSSSASPCLMRGLRDSWWVNSSCDLGLRLQRKEYG